MRPAISQRTHLAHNLEGLKEALHLAHTAEVSEIIISGPVAVDETLTVKGMRHDLVIRGRGDASIYAADGFDGPVFKVEAASANLSTTERPTVPTFSLRELYVRTGPVFIEAEDANRVRIFDVTAFSANFTDKFVEGTVDYLSIVGGEFYAVNVTSKRVIIRDIDLFYSITIASGGSAGDPCVVNINSTECSADVDAGIRLTGAYGHFVGHGNCGADNPHLDLLSLGIGWTYEFDTANANINYTVVT